MQTSVKSCIICNLTILIACVICVSPPLVIVINLNFNNLKLAAFLLYPLIMESVAQKLVNLVPLIIAKQLIMFEICNILMAAHQ